MTRNNKRIDDWKIDYLREHYHDTSNTDLAKTLCLSVYTVKSYCKKLRLRKDAEYISRLNRDRAIRCNNHERLNTPKAVAKRTATRIRINESERRRIRWGLEQKTKTHFRLEPRGKYEQRKYLRSRGYIVDNDTLTAYYTESTTRCPRIEAIPRGTKKGTIKTWYDFKPYNNGR